MLPLCRCQSNADSPPLPEDEEEEWLNRRSKKKERSRGIRWRRREDACEAMQKTKRRQSGGRGEWRRKRRVISSRDSKGGRGRIIERERVGGVRSESSCIRIFRLQLSVSADVPPTRTLKCYMNSWRSD